MLVPSSILLLCWKGFLYVFSSGKNSNKKPVSVNVKLLYPVTCAQCVLFFF